MEARHNGLPSQEHIHHYLLQKKDYYLLFFVKNFVKLFVFLHIHDFT